MGPGIGSTDGCSQPEAWLNHAMYSRYQALVDQSGGGTPAAIGTGGSGAARALPRTSEGGTPKRARKRREKELESM